MNTDLRLYICDKEIEFSQNPRVLLNYKHTELVNPTVVRNSFTKQIEIEGTPRNNDIFGHIWNLERVQDNNFNPLVKTDFQLFVNDELFQKGYVKLDKIKRTNNSTKYTITLYGGLGSFFYNLMYDQDDYGNTKKTLASLIYKTDYEPEPSLDFNITKENVYDAWAQLGGFGSRVDNKWDVINFIPALNGIPGDFDASKVLINNNNLSGNGFSKSVTDGGITYTPVFGGIADEDGYSLGQMEEDLQEWQTRDLRSYNQRPVLNMRRVIEACCQSENNGGYQVKLDSHFFNNSNPYYSSAWVTLPLLRDLDGVGKTDAYTITGATFGNKTTQYGAEWYPVSFNTPAATLNNVKLSVSLRFNPATTTSVSNLYMHREYYSKTTSLHGSTYVRNLEVNEGAVIQLFALDSGGNVVGQSKAYLLAGNKNYYKNSDTLWSLFYDKDDDLGVEPDYEFVEGYFKRIDGNYVFVNKDGEQTNIDFSFSTATDYTNLVMKVKTPYGYHVKYVFTGSGAFRSEDSDSFYVYTATTYSTTGNHTLSNALSNSRVSGSVSFVIESMEGLATDYEGLFSGSYISKDRLLSGEFSPADYLLSYCKLFGLYFYYDSTEEADDADKYPSGVVHIMDRDTFYTDEVMDLSKMIDWNKDVDITPVLADAKWYKFDTQHTESELETGYKEQFGRDYGAQLVNTSYNFDNNTTDLYDGNIFKTGIMALEKDKYYKKTNTGLPVYQYNGLEYSLFHRSSSNDDWDTYELDFRTTTTQKMGSINPDYEFYDAFPKLQFHGENNEAVDGSNVLVFFKGLAETDAYYWVTDDVLEMATLNDGAACWLLTKSEYDAAGNIIAKRTNKFPYFTRDLIVNGMYGNIVHSWNFGHPQVIYSPDTYTTEKDSIYDMLWKDFIGDVYNVNTRKMVCRVRAEMDDKPWPYWFRRFYWFENSIWRLNEITDLNVGSFDTTKMEFIKVLDMDDYKLEQIQYHGSNSIIIDQSSVPCTGGVVTGKVYIQSGGNWAAADYISGVDGLGNHIYLESSDAMSPHSGSGEVTNITVTFPDNTGTTNITWTVVIRDDYDQVHRAIVIQETCSAGSVLSVTPSEQQVSAASGTASYSITSFLVSGISVASDSVWATISSSATGFVVTYTANSGESGRTATFTISGTGIDGAISATATLVQRPVGQFSVSPGSLVFDFNETTQKTLTITSDESWNSTIYDI